MTKKHRAGETPQDEMKTTPLEKAAPAEAAQAQVESTPALTPEEAAAAQVLGVLQKDLAEAQRQRDEYLDGWQRAAAEFVNYKKRVERDREQTQQHLTGSLLKRYLEIADDLERALKARPVEGEGAAWANGVELIYRKLMVIFESQGIKPMDVLGQPFDPNSQEAIGQMDTNAIPSGHVAEVVQSGYLLGERVLRPALVRIAS